MNFGEVRIPRSEIIANRIHPLDLKFKYLLKAGFHHTGRVTSTEDFESMDIIFRQEVTIGSLIFKKFDWDYEHPWQKRKRLLKKVF